MLIFATNLHKIKLFTIIAHSQRKLRCIVIQQSMFSNGGKRVRKCQYGTFPPPIGQETGLGQESKASLRVCVE